MPGLGWIKVGEKISNGIPKENFSNIKGSQVMNKMMLKFCRLDFLHNSNMI